MYKKIQIRFLIVWIVFFLITGITAGILYFADNNLKIIEGKDLLFSLINPTAARAEGEKDYIIDTPGVVVKDKTISVNGSVIISADDVTLENVIIDCTGKSPHPDQDGIRAIGVNRLKIHLVIIKDCNRYGIYLKDGSGHDVAEGMIMRAGHEAVVFDNINNSWLIGWRMQGGVAIKNNSHDNRIISSVVTGNGQGNNRSLHPYSISADSYGNQIVRSRSRDSSKNSTTVISENPNNLWYQNICDEVSGYANCFFRNERELDGNYGDPAKFFPRIWSICEKGSTGSSFTCDFKTYNEAAKDSRVGNGEVLVMDSNTFPGSFVPPITISKSIWLIGNLMGQKGSYACEINIGAAKKAVLPGITVKSLGVRIENFKVNLPPVLLPDTEVVNVKIRNNGTDPWMFLNGDISLIPRLKFPGCS